MLSMGPRTTGCKWLRMICIINPREGFSLQVELIFIWLLQHGRSTAFSKHMFLWICDLVGRRKGNRSYFFALHLFSWLAGTFHLLSTSAEERLPPTMKIWLLYFCFLY